MADSDGSAVAQMAKMFFRFAVFLFSQLVFIYFLLSWLVDGQYYFETQFSQQAQENGVGDTTDQSAYVEGKLFAYHVLTEQCLPEYLLQDFVLGDASERDVYVLSYKEECIDADKRALHTTYVMGKRTSWSQGRNMLYEHVLRTGIRYKYHIYLDDDAILFETEWLDKFATEKGFDQDENPAEFMEAFSDSKDGLKNALYNWTKSPWRVFEETIVRESPAFAQVNLGQKLGFQSRRMQMEKWKLLCYNDVMPPITATMFLDTIIVAYHHKALPLLMPFDVTFDNHSWFISAMYQMYRMKALFFKQGIAIWSLSVINLKHREYPRNQPPDTYLQTYFEQDGRNIQSLLDSRDKDFVMYYDGGKWKDVFFGDLRLCTAPLKFPVTEHYQLSMDAVY